MYQTLANELNAAPIQHIGKLLVLWRPMIDMQSLTAVQLGDRVTVRRSAHKSLFLHPTGWSYYATLRRKLRWYEGNP